ncbi:MAG: magnesium transporter [Spirochaetes bacterium]|nr:magnesium transporter [Spirochaetota bacterium]
MIGKLILPEISELIKNNQFAVLRDSLGDWHPSDLAELIEDLPPIEQSVVFRILPPGMLADVFEYLDLELQKELLRSLGRGEVASILNGMSPDDRTALLEELPGPTTKQLLSLLSAEERSVALTLLGYPRDSVGRLMTPDYIAVREEWTVREVMDFIRSNGKDTESLSIIFVVDERGLLIDDIRINEFLLSPPERTVAEIMDRTFISLTATEDEQMAVELFEKYDRVALPVVDSGGYLIGIVTVDDVLDVVEQEHTEDIHRFGGVEVLGYPYRSTSLWEMIRHRIGWLVLLFFGEMLTASAMGFFEREIARAVVLALFVPLIISSGGNTGSQAATIIIRAMSLGEVTLRDWWFVMRRELVSGLVLGSVLGMIGFMRISLWSMFTDLYGPHWLLIAVSVAFSLMGVVMLGTITGSMLPFLLRRLGFDPASSSAPLVATVVDVTGLVIYFTISAVILRGTLL